MTSPLPPSDHEPEIAALRAFVTALPETAKRLVFDALADALTIPAEHRDIHTSRIARLIAGVREVATIVGGPPTVAQYRLTRAQRPDLGLAADTDLRRWADGTWNGVLAAASLGPVADGDIVAVAVGTQLTRGECLEAIRACTRDQDGRPPTYSQYLRWARRAEVRARPGRRPSSLSPFSRLFDGWLPALAASGVTTGGETPEDGDDSVRLRTQRGYRWSDEALGAALREVAERLEGRSPTTQAYTRQRQLVLDETRAAGAPRLLPGYIAFSRRWESWDAALEAAGLAPRGGRGVPSEPRRPHTPTGSRLRDERLTEVLRRARTQIEGPFTAGSFTAWRHEQMDTAASEGRWIEPIPSYHAIWARYGGWGAAVRAALESG